MALAAALDLVPSAPGHRGVDATLDLGAAEITVDALVDALLDCRQYPLTASYLGVPALQECRNLDRRDGYVVIYQRTGGNALVRPRHYVLAMKATVRTADRAVVEWWLVEHRLVDGRWTGDYAAALEAHPEAVWTPYNRGTWDYDRAAHTLRYRAWSDPGGAAPAWLVSEGAVLAFPKELLRTRFGVTGL